MSGILQDWDVETHDVKIIKLDKEIRLDNYHVKNMPHDVSTLIYYYRTMIHKI